MNKSHFSNNAGSATDDASQNSGSNFNDLDMLLQKKLQPRQKSMMFPVVKSSSSTTTLV